MNKTNIFLIISSMFLLTGCNNNVESSVNSSLNSIDTNDSNSNSEISTSSSIPQEDSSSTTIDEEEKYYTVSTCNFNETFPLGFQFNQSEDPTEQNQNNVNKFIDYMNEGPLTKDFVKEMETSKVQIGYYKDEYNSCLQLGSRNADGSVLFKFNYEIKRVVVSAINYSKQPYYYDNNSELEIGSSSESLTTYDLKTDETKNVIADLSFEKPVNTLYLAANGYSKYGSSARVSIEYITFYY